ncbi:MAG: class I SAM-dependent rRNA methyltransferase [Planctomycetaceae bacterium]|nr:class I SAM-dependent rRNA methyltransferase [Planctomycetaceae bacterium]
MSSPNSAATSAALLQDKQVVVRPPGRQAVLAGHPWLRRNSIASTSGELQSGDEVLILDREANVCGRGLYNPDSQLSVRVYSRHSNQVLDQAFWHARLQQAVALRQRLQLLQPNGACRLVFSEADQLSGLIVDQYADTLVLSLTARAMFQRWQIFAEWFRDHFRAVPISRILVRTDANILKQENMPEFQEVLLGDLPTAPIEFVENALRFQVDPIGGQKTGFYLDQRNNRETLGRLATGRMLDVCCYTGGFSLAAAKLGQTSSIMAVDSSMHALEQAERHAALNQVTGIDFVKGDCFDYLAHLKTEQSQFDTIVLDPPKFAGRQHDVNHALQAYTRLNRLAIDVLAPGGLLMTCSCSGRVLPEEFWQAVMLAGRKAGRDIQVVEQTGASPDHPILMSCPETQYLKCLLCRVH